MTRAYNLLYQDNITKLPVTHKYIKFSPANLAEVNRLHETDFILVDFPLHMEVIEMGDYYLPHGVPFATGIPDFYTVLKHNEVLPTVTHTVLEELVLAPYLSLLTYVAYQLSGEEHEGLPGLGTPGFSPTFCDPDCTYSLCCSFAGFPCEGPAPAFCNDVTTDCNPWPGVGTGDWPACLEIEEEEEEDLDLNACGCALQARRKPGGCIRVEDTQLPDNDFIDGQNRHMEGVNNVRVIWYDGWFSLKKTWTDENGCWQLTNHRERGKAYMWVSFTNDLIHVRSGLGTTWNLSYLLIPVLDYRGSFSGGTYNNIETNYTLWDVQGSKAHRRWGASHIMNGLPDFRDRISADGFDMPPTNLDVFMNMSDSPASNAPMFDHLTNNQVNDILNNGFVSNFAFSNLFGQLTDAQWEDMVWDMFLRVDDRTSDDIYETLYHEFFHAAHFNRVGGVYWIDLIVAEVLAGGWGDENSANAGLIAFCESIAEHIGWTYTHDRYLNRHSNGGTRTWERRLEEIRNRTTNHVPIGLYHDLKDAIPDIINPCDRDPVLCGPMPDNVDGFTDAQMLVLVNPLVTNMQIYEALIGTLVPGSGNTQADVNLLFNGY
jgi:hypothetical protein